MKRILLCCGAGFSSGLLAQKGRKAAKKRGINATVDAKSESLVSGCLNQVDVLLLGPHYANRLDEFIKIAKPYNVPVAVIPNDIYGLLDGEALLDFALRMCEENKLK